MMLKGPFRELIPVDAQVSIRIPQGSKVTGMQLLVRGQKLPFEVIEGIITVAVPQITDHEIVALDLA